MSKNYGNTALPPFQCFMGQWEGLCQTFDAQGNYLEASAVHLDVYWVAADIWHFHEQVDNLYNYGEAVFDLDLQVTGKSCFGQNEFVAITGTELTPYNYVFTIESNVTRSLVYNNHYFLNPNQRRVITHKLQNDKTHIFQIQDFSRVI